jgi:hypothetical protein
VDQPLAQGVFQSIFTPGGRVDLEEKLRIDSKAILPKIGQILKTCDKPCG